MRPGTFGFVALGYHDSPVKHENAPEFLRIKNIHALKFACLAEKLLVYLERKPDVGRVLLAEPKFHLKSSETVLNSAQGVIVMLDTHELHTEQQERELVLKNLREQIERDEQKISELGTTIENIRRELAAVKQTIDRLRKSFS